MSAGFTVDERDRSCLAIRFDGAELARYSDGTGVDDYEAPKPFLHPIRTLGGADVSVFRPWDHRWHKGIQMTLSEVSGQNFWGGPTFAAGRGYERQDNVGRIRRTGLELPERSPDGITIGERLEWVTAGGERWLGESRTIRFHGADPERGAWVLDFATSLTNVSGGELILGSPTTLGRPSAGYSGLFWRGPRAWTEPRVVGSDGTTGEALMGRRMPWIAMTGQNDGIDGAAAVIAYAGTSSADVPITWFVRTQPFAAINPSPCFDHTIRLAHADVLSLSHRFVFLDLPDEASDLVPLASKWELEVDGR